MFKTFAAALTVALASPFVNAYSLVETDLVFGKINAIDIENNVLVVTKPLGNKEELNLQPYAKIYFDGEKAALKDLSAGQKVRFERTVYTQGTENIEGEIVKLNRKKRIASIRVAHNEVVTVKFGENLTVKGKVNGSDFASLRKGHMVVVRAK